jgi:hypothetical protein
VKIKSTTTAGLTVQSKISRALDKNEYAVMSSLDLSEAFNVVNINLLVKRLKRIGISSGVVKVIQVTVGTQIL